MVNLLFRILWALVRVGWLFLPTRRGWSGGRGDPPTREQLAAKEAAGRRSAAQVGASPTDRELARALFRTSDLPPGFEEAWRGWTPLDPSDPILVSVQQNWERHSGRLWRRKPTQRLLLELRRYWSEDAATEDLATPPQRELPDGGRMRERPTLESAGIQIFEWTSSEWGQTAESLVELRLQRGTAAAVLRAASEDLTSDWERLTLELMQRIGERLR